VFHMYPHPLLEILPMVHNVVGLDLSGDRCGSPENGVDHIRPDYRVWLSRLTSQGFRNNGSQFSQIGEMQL
jgi:hypothetical protein